MKAIKIIVLTKKEEEILIKNFAIFKNSEMANYDYFGELLVYMIDNNVFTQADFSIEETDIAIIKKVIKDFRQELSLEKENVGYFITHLMKEDGSIYNSVLGYDIKII